MSDTAAAPKRRGYYVLNADYSFSPVADFFQYATLHYGRSHRLAYDRLPDGTEVETEFFGISPLDPPKPFHTRIKQVGRGWPDDIAWFRWSGTYKDAMMMHLEALRVATAAK